MVLAYVIIYRPNYDRKTYAKSNKLDVKIQYSNKKDTLKIKQSTFLLILVDVFRMMRINHILNVVSYLIFFSSRFKTLT